MAQREKVSAAKLDDMSSIPSTDVVVRNPVSGSCPLTCTHTIHIINKCYFKH